MRVIKKVDLTDRINQRYSSSSRFSSTVHRMGPVNCSLDVAFKRQISCLLLIAYRYNTLKQKYDIFFAHAAMLKIISCGVLLTYRLKNSELKRRLTIKITVYMGH